MWAQLMTIRSQPENEERLREVFAQLRAVEQPGSGLLRTMAMRSQADPATVYTLVIFESEAHARARENDPRREAGLAQVRALMGEVLEGPPQFTDLDVIVDLPGADPA
ncbi:MAG: hypothetical protein GC157_16495 [Frankiales bacterium]|nr:hypothetical protein [Frankiales bacterium]